jgi:hypothetical protein
VGAAIVIFHPSHAQLRHPFLQVDVSDAAWAETVWQVHIASLGDLLRLVALEQQRRYPNLVVAYPAETAARPISVIPYGFTLLVLRHPDLAVMVPELRSYPALAYPARCFPGGKADTILVVDGWQGEVTGLLAHTATLAIQLDGTLRGVTDVAWRLFDELGIVLDATLRIRDFRGPARARYSLDGWSGIDGLRRATGSFRSRPPKHLDPPTEGRGPQVEDRP